MSATVYILIAILVYLVGMLVIGGVYSKGNNSSGDFYLGGRRLGPVVTAMPANTRKNRPRVQKRNALRLAFSSLRKMFISHPLYRARVFSAEQNGGEQQTGKDDRRACRRVRRVIAAGGKDIGGVKVFERRGEPHGVLLKDADKRGEDEAREAEAYRRARDGAHPAAAWLPRWCRAWKWRPDRTRCTACCTRR